MRLLALAAGLALSIAAPAADLSVISTNAIKHAFAELAPQFEKGGHKLAITWASSPQIVQRIESGALFDAVISGAEQLEQLTDTGKLMAGSRSDIARSGIAVAVRAGAPKPDVSSADALKRALLAAKTVGVSAGVSGIYLNSVFERLGILQDVKPKLRTPPPNTPVGDLVAKGEAEIGFQQLSELVAVKGIEILGALPGELQRLTLFAGAVHARSSEPDAARALLRFLAQAEHAPLLQKHGLEPAASQY